MTTTPPSGAPARRTGSHTSLTHLTLAPLSTGRPLIDADEDDTYNPSADQYSCPHTYARSSSPPPSDLVSPAPTAPLHFGYDRQEYRRATSHRSSSYLAARSVPTTPGILSRTHSPTRAPKSAGIANSKSFAHLPLDVGSGVTTPASGQRTATLDVGAALAETKRQRDRARLRENRESSEWLYRHGAALAESAREGKGQSWLVSRASSTSLAPATERAEEPTTPQTPRYGPAFGMAAGRRSARQSRRGSRVNLAGLGMTTTSNFSTRVAGTPAAATAGSESGDYFGHRGVEGPDFINPLDNDVDADDADTSHFADAQETAQDARLDDAEIARLASETQQGFGLGGLVDKFVSWSLFDMGNDGKREEEEEALRAEEKTRMRRVRESQVELARMVQAGKVGGKGKEKATVAGEQEGKIAAEGTGQDAEEGGWKDAAWLLSVASKVIF